MGLFSWGGKPIKVETLENTHRKLDRDILALEKMNKVSGEWDRKIQEKKNGLNASSLTKTVIHFVSASLMWSFSRTLTLRQTIGCCSFPV